MEKDREDTRVASSESLKKYLKEISRLPRVTPAEEREIFDEQPVVNGILTPIRSNPRQVRQVGKQSGSILYSYRREHSNDRSARIRIGPRVSRWRTQPGICHRLSGLDGALSRHTLHWSFEFHRLVLAGDHLAKNRLVAEVSSTSPALRASVSSPIRIIVGQFHAGRTLRIITTRNRRTRRIERGDR